MYSYLARTFSVASELIFPLSPLQSILHTVLRDTTSLPPTMASLEWEDKIWDPQHGLWSPSLLLQPLLCSRNPNNILTFTSLEIPSSFLLQIFCTHYSLGLEYSFLMLCLINSCSSITSQFKYQFLKRPLHSLRLSELSIISHGAHFPNLYLNFCVNLPQVCLPHWNQSLGRHGHGGLGSQFPVLRVVSSTMWRAQQIISEWADEYLWKEGNHKSPKHVLQKPSYRQYKTSRKPKGPPPKGMAFHG